MKNHKYPLASISGSLLLACDATAAPTFQDDVKPILKSACFKCHNPDKKKADIDLTTYSGVLAGGSGGEIVRAGSPDGSVLYQAMAHTGDAETMPPNKDEPMAEAELEVIHGWIAGGLLEKKGGEAKAARRSPSLEVDPSALGGRPEGPPPMPGNLSAPAPAVTHPHPVIAMAASPWAPLVAVSGHEAVLLYNTDTEEFLGALPFPERTPHVLQFSRDGKLLLAAGGRGAHSGRVVVWDVATCERVVEVGDDEIDSVLAADISADRKYVALGGTDKILKIFSVESGELLHRIKKHTDWVTAVAFSPDGTAVASGDRNGGVHTWEAASGGILFTLAEHKKRISDLAWRPDGGALATAGEEGKLVLWGMDEGFASRVATPHKSGGGGDGAYRRRGKVDKGDSPGVLSVDYSHRGELLSAGRDGTVRLMRGDTREEARIGDFEDLPTSAVFSHDGTRVVTGDFLGNVRFWSVVRDKGKVKVEPRGGQSTKVVSG